MSQFHADFHVEKNSVAINLASKTVLKALDPKPNSPYWMQLEKGRHLGYRKIDKDRATWLARRRLDDAETSTGSASYEYKPLGTATKTFDYAAAKRDAEAWFRDRDAGVADDGPTTVTSACKEYVAALRDDGRDKTADDYEGRYKRLVYDDPLGKIPLDKLRTARLREWRNAIPGTKDTQNRNWAVLRAALNAAVTNRKVNAAAALEWRSVKQHKNASRRREIYLDLEERRRLIAACSGPLKALVEAATLTGARPGELVALKRKDFDGRTQTVKFSGKTGTRTVPLAPAAAQLFERLSKGRLPNAPLLDRGDGKPFDRWFEGVKDAAVKAGLPSGVSLYVLRHSWITEALRSGMSTLDVARLTGTSLTMIEKNYGHLVADSAQERLAQVTML